MTMTPGGRCPCTGVIEFDLEWDGTAWINDGPIDVPGECGSITNASLACTPEGEWYYTFIWSPCNYGAAMTKYVTMDLDENDDCLNPPSGTSILTLPAEAGCCGNTTIPFGGTILIEISS
jgi:hypothetical protein